MPFDAIRRHLLLGTAAAAGTAAARIGPSPACDEAGRRDREVVSEYDSPAVQRRLKYTALLPSGDLARPNRYPVLYLLHGHTGHYRSWRTYAGLPADAATRLGAIIVLADGGNAFYVNWQAAEEQRSQRWQDAITHDLVSEVDRRWPTRAGREARAIGGLSMGGYGAIAIALSRPELFTAAFSSAGALRFAAHAREDLRSGQDDWNRPELWSSEEKPAVDIDGFATQRERTPRGRVFGTAAQAEAADPFMLIEHIPPQQTPYMHLDCGLKDTLLPETRDFVARLRARGIDHSSLELPGDHETPYWAQAFEHSLLIMKQRLHVGDNTSTRTEAEI
jgi:putative tributyrin esterase